MYKTETMIKNRITSNIPIDKLYEQLFNETIFKEKPQDKNSFVIINCSTRKIIPLNNNKLSSPTKSGAKNSFNQAYAYMFGSKLCEFLNLDSKSLWYYTLVDLGIEYIHWLFETKKIEVIPLA